MLYYFALQNSHHITIPITIARLARIDVTQYLALAEV